MDIYRIERMAREAWRNRPGIVAVAVLGAIVVIAAAMAA